MDKARQKIITGAALTRRLCESRSHIERLLAFEREDFIVPLCLGYRVEGGRDVSRVVVELKRIVNGQRFRRAEHSRQCHFGHLELGIIAHFFYPYLGSAQRVYEAYLYFLFKERR